MFNAVLCFEKDDKRVFEQVMQNAMKTIDEVFSEQN